MGGAQSEYGNISSTAEAHYNIYYIYCQYSTIELMVYIYIIAPAAEDSAMRVWGGMYGMLCFIV